MAKIMNKNMNTIPIQLRVLFGTTMSAHAIKNAAMNDLWLSCRHLTTKL